MSIGLRVFIIITALVFLIFIVNLVKRKRLGEKDSLLWIIAALTILLVSIFPQIPDSIARSLGLFYPAAILFFVGIVFALFIIGYHSTRLSDLTEENKELAQKIGIMENRLKKVEGKKGDNKE
ncbi:MAG: DUF2304 domain-containing protein [Thermodesulfobacteriota bacterium]